MSELDDDSWLIGITIDNVGIVTSTLNDSDIEDIKEYELDVEIVDRNNGICNLETTVGIQLKLQAVYSKSKQSINQSRLLRLMILTITIARIVRTKGVDMFATTDTLVEMFPHTDGILDMFPHTGDIHNGVSGHVETCCLLERLLNAKDHVTFTLDMEDYYRIKDAEADKEKR